MGNEKKPLRLDVGEGKEYAENHEVIFLDVVDTYSYEKFDYQIQDAFRISPKDIKDEYEQLPKEKDVLAYCT